MLSRRTTLLAGAMLAAGGAGRHATAAAPRVRRLRLGHVLPGSSQIGAGAAAMATEVASRSGGRLKIQLCPDAILGDEIDLLEGVQLGSIDLAFISGVGLPNLLAEAGVFNIPFLFDSPAHAHAVLDGPIGDSYRQMLSEKGVVPLAWGENGLRHLTNSKHPIATPADLRGLKLRLPQSPVMLLGFRALGAEASPLPFPQIYGALQAGVVDGQENPIANITTGMFARVQKFLTLSGHVYDPAVILMSPDAQDDLAAADQAIILDAAKAGALASRHCGAEAELSGVAALQRAGMQVLAGIDRASFIAALAPAALEFERMFGRQQIERIRHAA
jgi:tripartite ATP-independent transporter DctP family solute receptor